MCLSVTGRSGNIVSMLSSTDKLRRCWVSFGRVMSLLLPQRSTLRLGGRSGREVRKLFSHTRIFSVGGSEGSSVRPKFERFISFVCKDSLILLAISFSIVLSVDAIVTVIMMQ